jgi:hypothetical protein
MALESPLRKTKKALNGRAMKAQGEALGKLRASQPLAL